MVYCDRTHIHAVVKMIKKKLFEQMRCDLTGLWNKNDKQIFFVNVLTNIRSLPRKVISLWFGILPPKILGGYFQQ